MEPGEKDDQAATPFIIAICCVCSKVRDGATASQPGGEEWVNLRGYMDKHGLRSGDVLLSHAYCPECLQHYAQVMHRVFYGRGG